MIEVSVIITSYNKGKLIYDAVNSVNKQSFKNIELIIVDDCSDDKETIKVLGDLSSAGIRIIFNEKNIGVCESRNIGINASNGKYILLLDGDDRIAETYIELALSIFKSDNEIKIVSCEVELFGYKKGKLNLLNPEIENLIAQNALVISSMFRKEDFDRSNGFNTNMAEGFEDWDFWLTLLENGGKVYRIPKALFFYRISKKSRNNLDFIKLRRLRKQIYENHKDLYAKYLLDPVISFEYSLIKESWEYKVGKILLKPLRFIIQKLT